MISRIKGKLVETRDNKVVVDVGGICYEINVSSSTLSRLDKTGDVPVEIIVYHYLSIDKNRAIPVLIGFTEELEKDFFEKFISVSGIGPRVAVKAFSKPPALIARAIEEGDYNFLQALDGIGKQKAKLIIASLQGKVGRFALIKEEEHSSLAAHKEIAQEARQILKRLQYNAKEIEEMIDKALGARPDISTTEDLLNEVYRQKH